MSAIKLTGENYIDIHVRYGASINRVFDVKIKSSGLPFNFSGYTALLEVYTSEVDKTPNLTFSTSDGILATPGKITLSKPNTVWDVKLRRRSYIYFLWLTDSNNNKELWLNGKWIVEDSVNSYQNITTAIEIDTANSVLTLEVQTSSTDLTSVYSQLADHESRIDVLESSPSGGMNNIFDFTNEPFIDWFAELNNVPHTPGGSTNNTVAFKYFIDPGIVRSLGMAILPDSGIEANDGRVGVSLYSRPIAIDSQAHLFSSGDIFIESENGVYLDGGPSGSVEYNGLLKGKDALFLGNITLNGDPDRGDLTAVVENMFIGETDGVPIFAGSHYRILSSGTSNALTETWGVIDMNNTLNAVDHYMRIKTYGADLFIESDPDPGLVGGNVNLRGGDITGSYASMILGPEGAGIDAVESDIGLISTYGIMLDVGVGPFRVYGLQEEVAPTYMLTYNPGTNEITFSSI